MQRASSVSSTWHHLRRESLAQSRCLPACLHACAPSGQRLPCQQAMIQDACAFRFSKSEHVQVLALPEYMQWAAGFGAAAQHIMAHAGPSCGAVLRSSAAMQVPCSLGLFLSGR